MTERKYPESAIDRARWGALEWLQEEKDGYPRSWQQESLDDKRRGYVMYDDFEAPPIAGYEALEREGLAVRLGTVVSSRQERIHFRLVLALAETEPRVDEQPDQMRHNRNERGQ